jgi:tetratricopeptide (TPR) repeat protein
MGPAGPSTLPDTGAGGPTVSVGVPTPGGAPIPNPEALDHYLTGRLLEEREMDAEALEEYLRALEFDPGRAAIERRISEVCSRMGDARRALEYAGLALQHEPGDARAHWLMGSALFNLGNPSQALAELRSAVTADPRQVVYWRTLAHVAESLDHVEEVADGWRHTVELDDGDAEAWFQLAAAEARLGHFEAADSMLAEAGALNPVRPGILFLQGWIQEGLGRPGEAVTLYREHLRVHPDDQATRRRLVNLLARDGRHAEAYREAIIVRRAQPEDPEAIGVEADLALYVGQTARAAELIDQLLSADPDDPTRVMQAAGILAGHGRTREALARTEVWADAHPQDYRGALLVARSRSDAGDTTGAVAMARRAVAMAPDSLAPRFVLGGLLQASRRYAAAESVWVEVTRRMPEATRAGMELAYCRQSQGDIEGAVGALRDVIAREPDNASALNFLGYLFADRDRDLEEAEGLIRRALAQDPDNGAYVDSMGWVYYRLGRLEEARRELERAVELTRGDAVVLEHLGDVYKSLRLFELARDQYRLSLSREKGNDRVRAKLSELH